MPAFLTDNRIILGQAAGICSRPTVWYVGYYLGILWGKRELQYLIFGEFSKKYYKARMNLNLQAQASRMYPANCTAIQELLGGFLTWFECPTTTRFTMGAPHLRPWSSFECRPCFFFFSHYFELSYVVGNEFLTAWKRWKILHVKRRQYNRRRSSWFGNKEDILKFITQLLCFVCFDE